MSGDGGPAFPAYSTNPWGRVTIEGGLSKRDLIAAMAMQGLLAAGAYDHEVKQEIAHDAVTLTDALLAELARERDDG